MRMKPGPSSVRFFSKYVQSTMSRASSLTYHSSSAGCLRQRSHCLRDSRKRVNVSLASERVASAAEGQPQRHRAELQVAAHRVEQVPAVAFWQLVGAAAEHDESRRPRFHLGDVAQLDALA